MPSAESILSKQNLPSKDAYDLSRERVRRAELSLALLKRYMPEAIASPNGVRR